MARREIIVEELVEILYQWHKGRSNSEIKRSLGVDRKTIRKYVEMGQTHGLTREEEPREYEYYLKIAGKIRDSIKTPMEGSESYRKTLRYQEVIEKLKKRGVKEKQIYRIIKKNNGYELSHSSFNRYMNIKYPKEQRNCLRIEVKAGEEAQVDFGSAGKMYDSVERRMRRAYAFVMSMSYSRLPYVEFVFDQGQETWIKCHTNGFEFFQGVPERIVLDNLKAGVLKANTYDPVFNKGYGECGKHYGFVIDPAKQARGDHKGKVERKIPVIRDQFLTSYEAADIKEANEKVKEWIIYEYGMEIHGTTKRKPWEVFQTEEKERLKELPAERFETPLWKECKIHPDHHIVFDRSYYSLPTRFIGKKVWVRGGLYQVQIFYEGEIIRTHPRRYIPGSWETDENDYPPEKSKYLLKSRSYYENEAEKYGEHAVGLVRKIMEEHAYRNLRKVQGIFRLGEKYGKEEINAACKRCLFYEDWKMSTIKKILEHRLYLLPFESEEKKEPEMQQLIFLRPAEYFIHREEGGMS